MRGDRDAVVWVADDVVAPGLDYGVRLAERLRASGFRTYLQDLTSGDGGYPPAALHVLSGGGTSVADRSGWMPRALDTVGSLVEAAGRGETALLGVCLGAQMIAAALWPGSVGGGDQIEVGLTEVRWRGRAGCGGEPVVVPAFHFETIDSARAVTGGATVIAENHRRALQGFRMGERICGVQFHPELEPGDVARLVRYHRATIEAHRGSVTAALGSVAALKHRWRSDVFDHVMEWTGCQSRD